MPWNTTSQPSLTSIITRHPNAPPLDDAVKLAPNHPHDHRQTYEKPKQFAEDYSRNQSALPPLFALPRAGRSKDANNGNDHQQLDQRKSPAPASLQMEIQSFHTPKIKQKPG